MVGRCCLFTPNSAIKARMPPSPSLSTLMAKETYLTVVMMNSVQSTSDSGTEHGLRAMRGAGHAQNRLEGVERACPDIAEHDAERRQRQDRQLALRRLPPRFDGNRCRSLAQCDADPMRWFSRQPPGGRPLCPMTASRPDKPG